MMRIALITDGMSPYALGGMQRHSRMLAEHLGKAGARVTVFHTVLDGGNASAASALAGFPTTLRDVVSNEFVPYPSARHYPGHYLVQEWRYSSACLRRYIDRGVDADFIYAQGLTGWTFLRWRRRRDRLPPIGVNTHGYEMFQRAATFRGTLQHALLRPAFKDVNLRADAVFSFSGKIRRLVEERIGVPSSRILEMPNGVEDAWIVDRPGEPQPGLRRFIFIGRHDRRKGLPELLLALGDLPPQGWSLDVVGPVPPSLQLDRPGVRFIGAVSDASRLQGLIDGADCLLCPSHAEGMPTVVLESMARGLMVAATDVGATAELVDTSNGILLGSPDPREIAGAMRHVMGMSDGALMDCKRRSLQRVRSYSWSRVASQVIRAAESFRVRRLARPA